MQSKAPITHLLEDWKQGKHTAMDQVFSEVYHELRNHAKKRLANERAGHTLQPTALVNEVYCKFVDNRDMHILDRGHFFAVAGRMMRQVLVDYARKRNSEKRGFGELFLTLNSQISGVEKDEISWLALDKALSDMEESDPRQVSMVEMRFFADLTTSEISEILQVSERTVRRELRAAKAWLNHVLS